MKPPKFIIPFLALSCAWMFLIAAITGCQHRLDPGANAFVVRVEQIETTAKSSFDLVVHLDDANRSFWRTNLPAFHQFAEWLRVPTPAGTNVLPRCSAMLWSLNTIKVDYKASRADSNALFSALSVVQSALNQSQLWLTQASTNSFTR